jgi:hypothetical protein
LLSPYTIIQQRILSFSIRPSRRTLKHRYKFPSLGVGFALLPEREVGMKVRAPWEFTRRPCAADAMHTPRLVNDLIRLRMSVNDPIAACTHYRKSPLQAQMLVNELGLHRKLTENAAAVSFRKAAFYACGTGLMGVSSSVRSTCRRVRRVPMLHSTSATLIDRSSCGSLLVEKCTRASVTALQDLKWRFSQSTRLTILTASEETACWKAFLNPGYRHVSTAKAPTRRFMRTAN